MKYVRKLEFCHFARANFGLARGWLLSGIICSCTTQCPFDWVKKKKNRQGTEAITKFSHGAVIQNYNGNVQKQGAINSNCILKLADSEEKRKCRVEAKWHFCPLFVLVSRFIIEMMSFNSAAKTR